MKQEIQAQFHCSQHQSISSNHPSQYLEQYLKLISPLTWSQQTRLNNNLISKSFNQNIKYDEKEEYFIFKISVVKYTLKHQILNLNIHFGKFTIPILLLNVLQKSMNHSINQTYSGNFASIFRTFIDNNQIAIKCHHIRINFQQTIKSVIKEYCLVWIASFLNAGPRLYRPFGFDIIAYEDCIQFSMQFCRQQLYRNRQQGALQSDLKEALKHLHINHIVHQDIKPQNICYSFQAKRYVFIDFGLSNILKEELGYKTFTYFTGSFQFCSPDMKDCYLNNEPHYIDLYYNDAYSLELAISRIELMEQEIVIQNEINQDIYIERFDPIKANIGAIFKFHLYFVHNIQHYEILKDLFKNNKSLIFMKYEAQLISFAHSISFSHLLQQFFELHFCKQTKINGRLVLTEYRNKFIYKQIENYNPSTEQAYYLSRYQQLLKINGQSLQYFEHSNQWVQDILQQNKIKKYSKQIYFFILADQLQINSFALESNLKFKACGLMKTLYPNLFNSSQIVGLQLYQASICILLNYSLQTPATKIKLEILYRLIPTLFIIEIIEQNNIIDLMVKVISKSFSIMNKLRMIVRCLSSIQWIKQKHTTIYNDKKLQFNLLNIAHQFMKQLPENDNNNVKFYVSLLTQIVKCHLGLRKQVGLNHKINYLIQVVNSTTGQQKCLCSELLNFSIYNELIFTRYELGISHLCLIRKLQEYIWSYAKNKRIIQYFHFILFHVHIIQNSDLIYQPIYKQFQNNFNQFPKYNCFSITMIFKFKCSRNNNNMYRQIIQEINSIFSICKPQFQWTLINYICKTVCQNKTYSIQKEVQFLQTFYINRKHLNYVNLLHDNHKNFPLIHKHNLPNNIQIIINCFITIHCLNVIDNSVIVAYLQLTQSLDSLLQKETCLQCKFKSYLAILPLRVLSLQFNKKWEEIIEIYLQISQVILKISSIKTQAIKFINYIITIILKHQQLFQIYQPFLLHYEYIKILDAYFYYLNSPQTISLLPFIYIQLYRLDQFDQLYDLIYSLLRLLDRNVSSLLIINFHKIMLKCVKQFKQSKEEYFYQKHHTIVVKLKRSYNNYVGLYFIIILQSVDGPKSQTAIFLKICRTLSFTDKLTRQIILTRLYLKFIELQSIKGRRLTYLMKVSSKRSSRKIEINEIVNKQIKNDRFVVKHIKKYKNKITQFSINIGNFNKNKNDSNTKLQIFQPLKLKNI